MMNVLMGMGGVFLGVSLFWAGYYTAKKRPSASRPMTEKEQESMARSVQELTNFYAYDGTVQEDYRADVSQ